MSKESKYQWAREALAAVERVYLRAAGWLFVGDDYWVHYDKRRFRYLRYRTGHAVNAQKLHDISRWP